MLVGEQLGVGTGGLSQEAKKSQRVFYSFDSRVVNRTEKKEHPCLISRSTGVRDTCMLR